MKNYFLEEKYQRGKIPQALLVVEVTSIIL